MKIKEVSLLDQKGCFEFFKIHDPSYIIKSIARFSQFKSRRLIIIIEKEEVSITKDKEGKTHIMRKEVFNNILNKAGLEEKDGARQAFWELLPPDEFNKSGILERVRRLKISRERERSSG